MKTYAEKEGQQPFNWYEALSKENITLKEWTHMGILSMYWVTCACGNQCDVIPRGDGGSPMDTRLRILGVDFEKQVRMRNKNKALETLYQIEQRSAELIQEINKTK